MLSATTIQRTQHVDLSAVSGYHCCVWLHNLYTCSVEVLQLRWNHLLERLVLCTVNVSHIFTKTRLSFIYICVSSVLCCLFLQCWIFNVQQQNDWLSGLQTLAQSTLLFTVFGQALFNCSTQSSVLQSQGCADVCSCLLWITPDLGKIFCDKGIPYALLRFENCLVIQGCFHLCAYFNLTSSPYKYLIREPSVDLKTWPWH